MMDGGSGHGDWHVGGRLLAWGRREGGSAGGLLCVKKAVVCVGGRLVRRSSSVGLCRRCLRNILLWIGTLKCPHLIRLCWSICRPIGTLAGVTLWPRNFPEALIKGQIVPNGVFPSASSSAVVGKRVTDPGVDVIQTQLPFRCSCYCHGDESGIAVGGFPFVVGMGGVR